MWQITEAPQLKSNVNPLSFHIYLKHKINWTSEGILFQPRKDVNT